MTERTTEEFVYEYWDCPRCGNKGIRGDFRMCGDCGFARDDTITFYRKEEDELVTDEGQVEDFKKGPDWICSFCESMISQKEGKCSSCGATRDDSVKNYFDLQAKKEQQTGTYQPPGEVAAAESAKKDEPEGEPKSKKIWFILGGAAIVIAGIIFWSMSTDDIEYKVKSVFWERAVPIERYQRVTGTDWENEVKGDDINVIRRNREIKKYEDRQVGTKTESYMEDVKFQSGTEEKCTTSYKSTGSGASKKVTKCVDVPVYKTKKVSKTREVPVYKKFPVYDTKVTYSSNKYALFRTARKTGNDNNPGLPEVSLQSGLDSKPDKEGEKTSQNKVTIVKIKVSDSGPKQSVFLTTEDLFKKKYLVNSTIKIKVKKTGSIDYEDGEKEVNVVK